MVFIRKFLILLHRYLGIVLSLFFVIWFVSGIGMMYAGGMPGLTPQLRLERLAPLNFDRIQLAPQGDAGRVVLLMMMGRPAYRIDGQTIFADNGEMLGEVDQSKAILIASEFIGVPQDKVRYEELLTEADQWTIEDRNQLPLHKLSINDADRTQLYISPLDGEVLRLTTRGSRALAWVAAIPHWLYFRPLRVNDTLWSQLVIWTSGVGCILAIAGIAVGIVQYRRARPHVPYSGWMRWHYITGVIFGIFTLTWVFSGMLSMEPFDWLSDGDLPINPDAFEDPLDLPNFPVTDLTRLNSVLPGREAKEVELARTQGIPYYVVRTVSERLLVEARPLAVRRELFSTDSILARLHEVAPDVPIAKSELLSDYDSYYYSRDRQSPLPVLRIKFDDPDRTWIYIDPARGRVVNAVGKMRRVQRWIYTGFHDLDFSFWYYNRPLWDIGTIILLAGGILSSTIGLFVGIKRVFRGIRRLNAG